MCSAMLTGKLAAQERTISGKITDWEGKPIPNATIIIKGSSRGTSSTDNGSFSLPITPGARTIVFSAVGHSTQEVSIGNKGIINVTLQPSDKDLQEVVVVGYGTQKKSNLTSAVVKVGGDKLENVPVPTVDAMLQGKVPGLQSVGYSGQPGANQQIRIRGIGSAYSIAASQPLYVIDGVQINSGDIANGNSNTGFNINPSTNVLATLNSNDIESMTVLKDAAATSIYGARGANGVILITTKSGKSGKTQFRFDTEVGATKLLKMPENGRPLRTTEWLALLKEGLVNANTAQATIDATMTAYGQGSGLDVDWMDLITHTGTQQQYNLSASGGDQKTKFFVSGGYFKQQGATIGSDLTRYTNNIKVTNNPTSRLSFTTKLNVGYGIQHSSLAAGGQQGGSGGGYFGNPLYVALTLRPTQNPYNADGSFNISTTSNFGFPSHYNPLYVAAKDKRWIKELQALGGETVEYKILDNLKFTSNFGAQYYTSEEYQYNNPFYGDASTSTGEGISVYTRTFLYDWYNQLDYHMDIIKDKKFSLDLKAGYEIIKNNRYQQIGDVTSFPPNTDLYYSNNGATSTNGKNNASDYSFESIYATASFSYMDKFSLYGSFRRDGSSRFSANNVYGYFPAVGAAWTVSNEEFFKNITFINTLKLRASYGSAGNAEIGNYTWRQTFGYGANYNGVAGGTFSQIGNSELTWEQNRQSDIGLDLGLFKNRLSITFDYYKRVSDRLLFNQQLSRTTGFTTFINNIGKMQNQGIELGINGSIIQLKNFHWDMSFSISHNTNKILRLPAGDVPDGNFLLREGHDYREFYTRGWAGVNPDDGSAMYYTDSSRTAVTTNKSLAKLFLVGKSATPKYFGMLSSTFGYKDFSVSGDFYYNYGNYIYEGYVQYFLDGQYPTRGKYAENLKRWQKKGDLTDVPKYVYGASSNTTGATTERILYKGDFIRLKNVTIGYHLSSKALLNRLHLNTLNIYVRGTNLWTKTYDRNITSDPEQGANSINNQALLPNKTFTVGLNVGF